MVMGVPARYLARSCRSVKRLGDGVAGPEYTAVSGWLEKHLCRACTPPGWLADSSNAAPAAVCMRIATSCWLGECCGCAGCQAAERSTPEWLAAGRSTEPLLLHPARACMARGISVPGSRPADLRPRCSGCAGGLHIAAATADRTQTGAAAVTASAPAGPAKEL